MSDTIFISMAAYQDPMLFFTLQHAISKAARPELLRFAVVDQNGSDQRAALAALPYGRQIRYVHVYPRDTLGVCWARSVCFSLYDGEAYLLQIDSHTYFEPGWDDLLRQQHQALLARSAKPLITTYPYRFDMVDGEPVYTPSEGKTALVLRPHPDTPLKDDDVVLRFQGRHLFTEEPVLGCHIAAGFLFAGGSFVEEVPYDPYLYFHGEEQSLAVRAFTRGWDIYHTTSVPLYHLYKQANTPHTTHHWYGDIDSQRAFTGAYLTERARQRLFRLLTGPATGSAFGLGSVRSLADFAALSGIDYAARTISDPFDGRLC